jgi:hypothetical protein
VKTIEVIIHTGHLSVDNGAIGPLTIYSQLAKLLEVEAQYGQGYGDDRLEIPEDTWPTVKDLLEESRLLYQVRGVHATWQNVLTEKVARRLQPVAIA